MGEVDVERIKIHAERVDALNVAVREAIRGGMLCHFALEEYGTEESIALLTSLDGTEHFNVDIGVDGFNAIVARLRKGGVDGLVHIGPQSAVFVCTKYLSSVEVSRKRTAKRKQECVLIRLKFRGTSTALNYRATTEEALPSEDLMLFADTVLMHMHNRTAAKDKTR